MQNAISGLVGMCIVLLFLAMYFKSRADRATDLLEAERRRGQSLSTTYGKISEQWFPLMDGFPYDSHNFRFLGAPIDGIQFEEDKIVFCEFKANHSQLTTDQRHIKRLIQDRKVYWEEFHFSEN